MGLRATFGYAQSLESEALSAKEQLLAKVQKQEDSEGHHACNRVRQCLRTGFTRSSNV
jgi:hypothetical protein